MAAGQQHADLGLGGFQLAQLEAGKALVGQGLDNSHEGVQVRHRQAVEFREPVQGVQAVAVGRRAVVPAGDVHPSLCWSIPQIPHWPVGCLQFHIHSSVTK